MSCNGRCHVEANCCTHGTSTILWYIHVRNNAQKPSSSLLIFDVSSGFLSLSNARDLEGGKLHSGLSGEVQPSCAFPAPQSTQNKMRHPVRHDFFCFWCKSCSMSGSRSCESSCDRNCVDAQMDSHLGARLSAILVISKCETKN